jgi:hypothetical protein
MLEEVVIDIEVMSVNDDINFLAKNADFVENKHTWLSIGYYRITQEDLCAILDKLVEKHIHFFS